MSIEHAGQKWRIVKTKDPIGGDRKNRSILGETDEADNLIIIDGTLPKTRQAEVLLHELVHIADMTVPEFAVSNIAKNLYGILVNNKVLRTAWVDDILDGTATAAEAARVNETSKEIKEGVAMFFYGVDESPWAGPGIVETGLPGMHKYSLDIKTQDGRVNRTAARKAEASIITGQRVYNYRQLSRELVTVMADLGETPHQRILDWARG